MQLLTCHPYSVFNIIDNISQFITICVSFGWIDSLNKVNNRGNTLLCDPVECDDIANCDEFFEFNRYS